MQNEDDIRNQVEYKFIEGKDPSDFSGQVQELLRQGFSFRTDPYTDNGKVYGEMVKLPTMRRTGYPTLGQVVTPAYPVGYPAIPPIDFFQSIGVGPEGKELLMRMGKAYNNPEFRKMLEETVGDFVSEEDNTAMSDEELKRLSELE